MDLKSEDKHKTTSLATHKAGNIILCIEKSCNVGFKTFLIQDFDKIRDICQNEMFKPTIGVMFTKIIMLSGISGELDDFNKQDISKMLVTRYKNLSIEEIYYAFELERHGAYHERTKHFNLFNAEYVSTILEKFKKWKQETKTTHNISKTKQVNERTKEEIEVMNLVSLLNEFEYYKTNLKLPNDGLGAHVSFDILRQRNVIKNDERHEKYYMKKYLEAQKELVEEKENEFKGSQDECKTLKKTISELKAGVSEMIEKRQKRLVLIDFYNRLIKDGIDLKEKLQ